MAHRTTDERLIQCPEKVRTVGRAGYKYTDEAFNRRWLERVKANTVATPSGCWIWQGWKTRNGYGSTAYRGKNCIIHRKTLELATGIKLDRWEYACHSCDVKLCCNPAHLWKGTPKQNSVDSADKGRHQEVKRTHCVRGHPLSGDNLILRKQAAGRGPRMRRICRECERIRMRLKIGWTVEQAMTLPVTPHGERPVAGRKSP